MTDTASAQETYSLRFLGHITDLQANSLPGKPVYLQKEKGTILKEVSDSFGRVFIDISDTGMYKFTFSKNCEFNIGVTNLKEDIQPLDTVLYCDSIIMKYKVLAIIELPPLLHYAQNHTSKIEPQVYTNSAISLLSKDSLKYDSLTTKAGVYTELVDTTKPILYIIDGIQVTNPTSKMIRDGINVIVPPTNSLPAKYSNKEREK